MANDEAWQAGSDIAQDHKWRKNQKKNQDSGGSSSGGGNPYSILSYIPKLHKGGKVKKTGNYRLRKGEVVLTAAQQKSAGLKKAKKSASRKRVTAKR